MGKRGYGTKERVDFFGSQHGKDKEANVGGSETSEEVEVREGGKGVLKVLFWNIAGVKNKDEEAFKYLRKHDIIGLSETWLEKKDEEKLKNKLKGYEMWAYQAERCKKKGRAKGGLAIAIKKDIMSGDSRWKVDIEKEMGWIDWDNGLEKWTFAAIYSRERRERIWERISKENERTRIEGRNIIIGGDFNARTGRERGKRVGDEKRMSKDKVINKEGREMMGMLDEEGLFVMNGGEKGDTEGNLTYVGGGGESVIDYAVTNLQSEDLIRKFEIGNFEGSDHLPLEVEIERVEDERSRKEEEVVRKQRIWNPQCSEKLEELVKKEGGEMSWRKLKEMVWEVMEVREVKTWEGSGNKK